MADVYKITPEQQEILASFTCQRLKDCPENEQLVRQFRSENGELLVENLQNNGWEADRKGSVAYYVIKNAQGEIVMFYSLKCGVLFDPNAMAEFVQDFSDIALYRVWAASQRGNSLARNKLAFRERLMHPDKFSRRIKTIKAFHHIKSDKKNPAFANMVRVLEGHSAVELVEFCANDVTKDCWPRARMGFQRMGETFFWHFIYPQMLSLRDLVGCDYAFLFAADKSPDGSLVQYYHSLHFTEMPALGTVKPYYDMNCYFLGKRLVTLEYDQLSQEDLDADPELAGLDFYQMEFFRNFNRNTQADDIF